MDPANSISLDLDPESSSSLFVGPVSNQNFVSFAELGANKVARTVRVQCGDPGKQCRIPEEEKLGQAGYEKSAPKCSLYGPSVRISRLVRVAGDCPALSVRCCR